MGADTVINGGEGGSVGEEGRWEHSDFSVVISAWVQDWVMGQSIGLVGSSWKVDKCVVVVSKMGNVMSHSAVDVLGVTIIL